MFQTNIGQLVCIFLLQQWKWIQKKPTHQTLGVAKHQTDSMSGTENVSEAFTNHSLQLELTVEGFFFTISDINTEVS